jgi:UDP-2,3-diacylglucosamine hydrolase
MKTIFLSDAHLKSRRDKGYQDLLGFMDVLQTSGVDRLVIAGDFFDFWFGNDHRIYPEFQDIIDRLVMLKRQGVQISLCEGNHDFSLGDYFSEKLGMTVYEDWAVMEIDGWKILVGHGDLVDRRNMKYLILRKLLRSGVFNRVQRMMPAGLLWKTAGMTSHTSRELTASAAAEDRLVGKMIAFAGQKFCEGFDAVILGHAHKPLLKEYVVNGRQKIFATLGDWTRHNSYVRFEDGRFQLACYRP